MSRISGLVLGVVALSACDPTFEDPTRDAADETAFEAADADGLPIYYGGKELLGVSPDYRSVGYEAAGPLSSGLASSSEVWSVTRRWYEVSAEAGIAWSANSGLTWDEKYAAWVDAMDKTTGDDGHQTVELTTPWGKNLPSPRLECAEMAMFLRATFAAWYELPFFMTGYSSTYGSVHYGHFGIVDHNGSRLSGYPRFATAYEDYTDDLAGQTDAYIVANWPDDAELETRYLTSSKDDYVDFLGPDAYAGAYLDEIHLNKRAGYFVLRLLVSFGSMHLAESSNAWNIAPAAMRPGDVLLHRWQSQGIGHAMVIKEVTDLGFGQVDAEIIFGSMPRIQPKWYGPSIAHSYFTSQYAGGPQTNSDGTAYSHLGGGLKRWRTPVIKDGRWKNIVPTDDRTDWIGSTDYPALEARITTLQGILGNLTPTEKRDALLERIEMARGNLAKHPSSCTNRQRREEAFDELYTLMADEWSWTREQVDRQYRTVDDYIFAELDYSSSKTCCWNTTTDEMYAIIVEYNTTLVTDAHAANQCVEPVVFKARGNGGYDPFRQYAYDTGRGSQWVEWSADETCPQAGVAEDTEANAPWSGFCTIADSLLDAPAPCANGQQETLWFADTDGDGFGDANDSVEACTAPADYVASADDCADGDRWSYPGATETCDGDDNDCDGTIDEGCSTGGDDGGGSSGTPGTDCGSCAGNPMDTPFGFVGLGGLMVFAGRRRRE